MYNQLDRPTEPLSPNPFNPMILRQMRWHVHLSMEAVALASGLHDKAQISRFERGIAIPLATTLGKLLQVLQPEPAHLYALFGLVQDSR